MTSPKDSIDIAWKNHLEDIKNSIDLYISSNYSPVCMAYIRVPDEYREHHEDRPAKLITKEDVAQDALLEKERSMESVDTSRLQKHLAIKHFLSRQSETFSQMLLRLIDERNLKDSEVYRNANIDRRLFSKIRGDEDYVPSKKTVICFCMALQLELPEARELLETAGYALSTSSKFDLIIMYLLENKEFNVVFANIVLEEYRESSLTR